MRKPLDFYVPEGDPKQAVRQIVRHLRRLYLEASDYRERLWYLGALGHAQSITIGGAPSFTPPRDRIYLGLQLVYKVLFDPGAAGVGAAARNSVRARLFVNGTGAGNTVFDLTVSAGAGTGWKRGITTTVVTLGQENLTTSDAWSILVESSGGSGNAAEEITLGVVYEDFTPYIDRAAS